MVSSLMEAESSTNTGVFATVLALARVHGTRRPPNVAWNVPTALARAGQ